MNVKLTIGAFSWWICIKLSRDECDQEQRKKNGFEFIKGIHINYYK